MLPNEQLIDNNRKEVALFPLEGFQISQPWWGTYSHDETRYYATDFLAYDQNGNRVNRANCYAPVKIRLLFVDPAECVALWQSTERVHFADGSIDYLGIIVYHDNDIEDGNYYPIGTIKNQGEVFNKSGTGAFATGDHVHLETGKGEVNLSENKYHFTDLTSCKRIKPDEALFINNTTIVQSQYDYGYNWLTYSGRNNSFRNFKKC